jgi:hypothetical protein
MVTAKSYNESIEDEELLTERDLPAWMELESVYAFSWENEKDDT